MRGADIDVDPVTRFGSARHPERTPLRSVPPGVTEQTVEALGALSAALEAAEDARGHLYAFHRLCGTADLTLQRAVTDLRAAGHVSIADELDEVLVGRDVIAGRWSYQLVEDYDAHYWQVFRAMEAHARQQAGDVPIHLHEALMQSDEQQHSGGEPR